VRLAVSGPPAATNLVWRGTNTYNWDTTTTKWASSAGGDVFYNLDWVLFDRQRFQLATGESGHHARARCHSIQRGQELHLRRQRRIKRTGSPLAKSGSGILTIATTNSSYTGNILVTGGTLQTVSGASIGQWRADNQRWRHIRPALQRELAVHREHCHCAGERDREHRVRHFGERLFRKFLFRQQQQCAEYRRQPGL
jgi:autotransporter-associated beta strand protein